MTWILVSAAASLSAISPVPSGLLSSTIRRSAVGTLALTLVTMSSRLSRSLYVGMMTATGPSGAAGRCDEVNLSCLDVTNGYAIKVQRCRGAAWLPGPAITADHHDRGQISRSHRPTQPRLRAEIPRFSGKEGALGGGQSGASQAVPVKLCQSSGASQAVPVKQGRGTAILRTGGRPAGRWLTLRCLLVAVPLPGPAPTRFAPTGERPTSDLVG